MQEPKRRSKRGVILLAVVVAMLVMAVLPAAALAADTVTINNGAPYANDVTVNLVISTTQPTASFYTTQTYAKHVGDATYSFSAESAPKVYTGGIAGSQTIQYTLVAPDSSFFVTRDSVYVKVRFYVSTTGSPGTGVGLLSTKDSNTVVMDFNGPPVSMLELDGGFFHPGRGDILWTNGDADGDVYGTFDQVWNAPMGTTHWQIQKNNGDMVVQTPITWAPWGTVTPGPYNTVELVAAPHPHALLNPQPLYSADGQYTIQHWAVDMFGQRQLDPQYSVDTFGYDTKAPYVVWTWPATTTGYYNAGTIAVSGDVIDDGGSGVAGYFPLADQWTHFTPSATVMWKSADTGNEWMPWTDPNQKALTVQINAFDHYRWHISGSIYVRPYYNAEYAVWVTGSDYAGNDGFPLEDWLIAQAPSASAANAAENTIGFGIPGQGVVVDNMAPSTIANGTPASAVVPSGGIGTWTNGDVVLNFVASDTGGSGIGSGVNYTEYIVGSSATTPPAITASGTKATSLTIKDPAPVGPVYVWYRSVDNVGNKEAWNLVWVYIDTKAPVLSIGGNTPWYNDEFSVVLSATDNNSHLATPGIEYQVPGWPMPFLLPHSGTLIPTTWTPLSQNPGTVWFPVDAYPNSRTDGIWALNMRATDQAGNSATNTTSTVQIDTRPPTTASSGTYGPDNWYNGTKPLALTATDQNPGSGVKVTWYRADQATPWTANVAATVATTLSTSVNLGTPIQGSVHTVDFFSIDNATNPTAIKNDVKYPGNVEKGVVVGWAPIPGHPYVNITSVAGYKTVNVKADVTAPTVTAMDPKNGNWQKPLATVNFSGTDVGSGYAYTEWSTDGGKTWTQGNQAQVGGDGVTTITYHGVDNVGLVSANQTIDVKVASTPPTVTAQNATATVGKKHHNPTIHFNITAVTPTATAVIQIRTLSGKTISTHHYANVPTGQDVSRTFVLHANLKAGKYNIRVGAVDEAGNVQTKRGTAKLTVK